MFGRGTARRGGARMPSPPSNEKVYRSMDDFYSFVRNCPMIDNHAHNLLRPSHLSAHPFESITTEANGEALDHTRFSLSHVRAVKQLAEFFDCDADWEAIKMSRKASLSLDSENITRKCFEGIHTILMDDGLDTENVQRYDWHKRFIPGTVYRVVRIEKEAENIARSMTIKKSPADLSDPYDLFSQFENHFEGAIEKAIKDRSVAAFKSVICYRTGLRISSGYAENIAKDFDTYLLKALKTGDYRIESHNLNNYLVNCTLNLLNEAEKRGVAKPIQFHTGLGDNDIDLLLSDPANLQQTIEDHPNVQFVILHSAYPYTREAGYLAAMYKNVFLDLGEVFPMLSREGQEAVMRQSLELVPWDKLLWSTDGHWFPETFWLANKQFRQVLEEVLSNGISRGDYSIAQAIDIVTGVMFDNSNALYNLSVERPPLRFPTAGPSFPVVERPRKETYNTRQLTTFLATNPSVNFIWIQWPEYNNILRVRMMMVNEFRQFITSGKRIGISEANMWTLADDTLLPGESATGQVSVEPDLSSLRPNAGDHTNSATVLCYWRTLAGEPLAGCPRTTLQYVLDTALNTYNLSFLVGFEIEVVFLPTDTLMPLDTNHAWSTLSATQRATLPFIYEIVTALTKTGIAVEQFHAESAPGQYEFVLPPLPPLQSIDALIQARQTITHIAESHSLRATLHPRPVATAGGTACHAHISLSNPSLESSFFAGILSHLTSIVAFTLPSSVSYARVGGGLWTGGEWIAWGTQNRETPLRKITAGRWEIRCLDGLANVYLALSAIIGAGLLGLRNKTKMTWKDCAAIPTMLSDEERAKYGIVSPMPKRFEEALGALGRDRELIDILGGDWVLKYVGMRRLSEEKLKSLGEEERRRWLIERY
ncbi:MAG: hypothetical protein M1834_004902 [Cirrosporium novae-zelandiae]|nr:MAG: hypothetical protein M1834_004902 [Cirrosporium novae-zelandiae]